MKNKWSKLVNVNKHKFWQDRVLHVCVPKPSKALWDGKTKIVKVMCTQNG